MSRIDRVRGRIRGLRPDQQEILAEELGGLLEGPADDSLLTDEQWDEVEAALAEGGASRLEDVFARLRAQAILRLQRESKKS